MEKFTDFLRAKRLEKRIPLRRVCWLTGITAMDYSRMERGVVKPDEASVNAIVTHFGLSEADNEKLVKLADKDRRNKRWKPAKQDLLPAFICTYDGHRPTKEELDKLFEFFDKSDSGNEDGTEGKSPSEQITQTKKGHGK